MGPLDSGNEARGEPILENDPLTLDVAMPSLWSTAFVDDTVMKKNAALVVQICRPLCDFEFS